MANSDYKLSLETRAVSVLKAALSEITDDKVAVRDTIEGETSIAEAIAAVMGDITDDEIMCVGIDKIMSDLHGRRARLEGRIESRKAAMQKAMEIGEIKTLPTPYGTISLRNVPRALNVTDENLIPFDYYEPQPPRLDRKKLKEDLKSGKEVPGCLLDNGSQTISIRRV